MALSQYCELDEVRAALGANRIELPDAVLNLPIYEMVLVRELAKISASLPAAFLSITGLDLVDRTEAQKKVFSSVRLFCAYTCARQVGVALPTMLPKDVGDGKSTMSRFADAPYRQVLEAVTDMAKSFRTEVEADYLALVGDEAPVPTNPAAGIFIASKRGYDPVTGE